MCHLFGYVLLDHIAIVFGNNRIVFIDHFNTGLYFVLVFIRPMQDFVYIDRLGSGR